MSLEPLVLLTPSQAAAIEMPRRLAAQDGALAAVYAFKVLDLARAVAEPVLLGQGLKAWDSGHDALLAAWLLGQGQHGLQVPEHLPRAPLAIALARTLGALRRAGVATARIDALADQADLLTDDVSRLRALATLYRGFDAAISGRFTDPATLLRAASQHVAQTAWLHGASVLILDDLVLGPLEQEFVAALAKVLPVRLLERTRPASLRGFADWARAHGIPAAAHAATPLRALAPPEPSPGLQRLRSALFEPAPPQPVADDSVELVTAPGEGAEVRALARRLLREAARGVAFEEMGVILPRPEEYAALFADLFDRIGIPYRLHPSLPLRSGRIARSLLLLLRCRGLQRFEVLEFLTFAPVPLGEILGRAQGPAPAQWDELSRDAGIVSGLERWIIGLRATAEEERDAAARESGSERRERRLQKASDADDLLRVVELLSGTLDGLSGEASWSEWSERLGDVFRQWLAPDEPGVRRAEWDAVAELICDLGGLGALSARAPWNEVEQVLEARLEFERMPLEPQNRGAVHVGVLDAMAGLPFRVVAIPGLVEGGFPGVLRPDPFLLDREREALAPRRPGQLSLFEEAAPAAPGPLPTTQDRLREARQAFHRAVGQATERLLLSYPRADSRSGRERMPSLFFVAAASALAGHPTSAADLTRMVLDDDFTQQPLEQALDRSERDRARVRSGGREAALAIAGGSIFFRQSHLAAEARRSPRLTAYDGLVAPLPPELAARLDPIAGSWPLSASKLATYSRCGFLYFLQHVLRLEPALEPEERKRLEPLERGNLFHQVAELFLRERRDRGELPIQDSPAEQARVLELADAALDELVAASPPRFTLLWQRERTRFREGVLGWLAREGDYAARTKPAHFEVSFGPSRERAAGEPHSTEPLSIPLPDGRTLRVAGKIDRIDRKPDGTLVLRDYKTGRAPRDDGGIFRGGRQLQIPFYILAAARLFPEHPVEEAFLDYVDGGRRVAVDPAAVLRPEFTTLLAGLVDLIAHGVFVQDPSACDFCDFTAVCGPKPLLERRAAIKRGDRNVQRVQQLREIE